MFLFAVLILVYESDTSKCLMSEFAASMRRWRL